MSHRLHGRGRQFELTWVLDIIDGQIEQENLAKAAMGRLSPDKVEGLQTPLPAYVSDEYRAKFVRAVEGTGATTVDAET